MHLFLVWLRTTYVRHALRRRVLSVLLLLPWLVVALRPYHIVLLLLFNATTVSLICNSTLAELCVLPLVTLAVLALSQWLEHTHTHMSFLLQMTYTLYFTKLVFRRFPLQQV